MKLKEISLRGFRGFHEERTIPLHDRLTLISAPNSHGKTSISEGFEWLLYGFTSKVALADSKDEYRGSYRNVHLLEPEVPSITVRVQDGDTSLELQAMLSGTDAVLRVDSRVVPAWPFANALAMAPKPFILQHALKDLLLAAPVDRFNRFAALLGFDELTQVHKDLMAFCTRPPLPPEARTFVADVDSLLIRVAADWQFASVTRLIKKGYSQFSAIRSSIDTLARGLVPAKTPASETLASLQKQKEVAVSKIFSGTVIVPAFTDAELAVLIADEESLVGRVATEATAIHGEIVKEASRGRILREARFYDLGLQLLAEIPSSCPFCLRHLDESDTSHIREHHVAIGVDKQGAAALERAQEALANLFSDIGQRISEYYKRVAGRTNGLLAVRAQIDQLEILLVGENESHVAAITEAIAEIDGDVSAFVDCGKEVRAQLKRIEERDVTPTALELLGTSLVHYVAAGRKLQVSINNRGASLSAAQKAVNEQVNKAAGTGTLSLVIELLENDRKIAKRLRIAAEIEGLKTLKSNLDEFVTTVMLEAISGELANDVMDWYKRIRTVGDPDVHFAGFDMKKTAQGGRVQIKASSYGKDLVSAVSSLSESKLNALGLCISIAINMKEQSPFEFLIIDDPIQSWDRDHEIQFISVIREIVERGKQVILLSHNGEWIKQVRSSCADMNGLYYEVTGYTASGPSILLLPWVEPQQRLHTILAILNDQTADSIRLQQAEEELRQVIHQYACSLHQAVRGTPKNPANLNAEKVRTILTECGIAMDLVGKVASVFDTVDDAHHAAPNYSPNRQKLRQYYEIAVRLSKEVEAKVRQGRTLSIMTAGKTA